MSKQRMQPGPDGRITFHVSSGFGGNTQRPFVEVEVAGQVTQMSPANARALGLNLLEAAEAAEGDEALIRFAVEAMDLDMPQAAQLLARFRELRAHIAGKGAKTA